MGKGNLCVSAIFKIKTPFILSFLAFGAHKASLWGENKSLLGFCEASILAGGSLVPSPRWVLGAPQDALSRGEPGISLQVPRGAGAELVSLQPWVEPPAHVWLAVGHVPLKGCRKQQEGACQGSQSSRTLAGSGGAGPGSSRLLLYP